MLCTRLCAVSTKQPIESWSDLKDCDYTCIEYKPLGGSCASRKLKLVLYAPVDSGSVFLAGNLFAAENLYVES